MATPVRQRFDRAVHEQRVIEVTRDLLRELGSYHTVESVCASAHLDRDLGIGSLERVELVSRLDREFQCKLSDSAVSEAVTLDDMIAALAASSDATTTETPEVRFAQRIDEVQREQVSSGAGLASAQTWQEVIRHRAQAEGGRTHLILSEDGEQGERITFADLYSGAKCVAGELARRGITRGDAVALMLPTCREFFATFAGVWLAGAVPVPIYPPTRPDRIEEYAARQSAILRNASVRLLVTFREAARIAQLLRPSVRSLTGVVTATALEEAASAQGGSVETDAVQSDGGDLALLQYTSGSTGDPKGVMLTHANLLANVRAIGEAISVRPDDVGISWLPLYHDMGLIGAWLMPLYFGLRVAVLSPVAFLNRPERWLRACHTYRGTLTAAPNFAYELAARRISDAEADREKWDLSSLRAVLNGAEPVNAATLERFGARFARYGLRREAMAPVYGLAEATLAVTVPPVGRGLRVDHVERESFTREGRAKPASADAAGDNASVLSFVSVGRCVPCCEIRIAGPNGREVGERVEGALWFRGPSATRGYFRNTRATEALFPEGQAAGWLDSGDRAYRVGDEFFITGRVKDIVLKAGRNVYPQEVEEIAGRVEGVRKGCVVAFGVADAASGTERLVVVAETRENGGEARQRITAAVIDGVAAGIGVPPDGVELVAPHSIPKTSSGKLRRDRTRQMFVAGKLGRDTAPPWVQVARLAAGGGLRAIGPTVRNLLERLYGVYATVVFLVWLPLTWLALLPMPNRRSAATLTSAALRAYLMVAGCRVRVEGRENMHGPGAHILVSNHTSYFDVLVLMATLGVDYHFVAKSEIRRMPFIGTFLTKLGGFWFDRNDPKARARQSEQMTEALRKGESVFVFPEGTFTAQPGVRRFQLGAFSAAVDAQCPVIPIGLRGTRRFLPDRKYLPRPTRVLVTVCPPLDVQRVPGPKLREIVRLRDAAREAIARESGEPML